MKGLVPKYVVRPPHPDCAALHAKKVEYAQDEEGRLWRRIYRAAPGYWTFQRHWSTVTRWHIADPWAWFPGADPSSIEGVRKANQRARPPKAFDVYLIRGRVDIVARPPYPSSPLREEIS